MRLAYISPSALPSRSANSVHVMLQCDGLAQAGVELKLYARRTIADEEQLLPALREAYGVDPGSMRLKTYFSKAPRGDNLRIAWLAVADLNGEGRTRSVISRNLYASYALAVLQRRPILFETHQLESGFRKAMQRMVMTRPWVTTVTISHRLVECLSEHHGVAPARGLVLHDAAPSGIVPLVPALRRSKIGAMEPRAAGPWDLVCGYFGHLYPGRGIEIIEAMAAQRPRCLFLVYGGNDQDIGRRRSSNSLDNLLYLGHVPHPVASRAMAAVDVLLMPYQHSVSIGVPGHDTARWMSPMKMFEYMASGVPLISSDLPVLREVLDDRRNCLLVPAADTAAWIGALDRLHDRRLAESIGAEASSDYRSKYTWRHRADRLLDAARAL